MTKDVLLSIKGLQIGENEQNDTIEVISPGDYYFRNGKHFFMYEEVMEGQKESTRNMIKVRDNYMELTKKGAVNVHMIFEKNKKNIDVVIMCGGSATDLPEQVPMFAKLYNTVDSFDTHKNIPEYYDLSLIHISEPTRPY